MRARMLASALGVAAMLAAPARAECTTPAALAGFGAPLPHCAARLAAGQGLKIVAFGSSSTAGTGASTPAMSYPSRLAAALREKLPGIAIEVVNHGVGGQDIDEELQRLRHDVLAEHPDLVIWQLGTNALLRRENPDTAAPLIARGIALVKSQGIDLVLMDMQYAPRVLARPGHGAMQALIADAARGAKIGLFRRFAIMRRWAETRQLAPAPMIAPDGLHMTDASYGCLADTLAAVLLRDLGKQAKIARAAGGARHAVAGLGSADAPVGPAPR